MFVSICINFLKKGRLIHKIIKSVHSQVKLPLKKEILETAEALNIEECENV